MTIINTGEAGMTNNNNNNNNTVIRQQPETGHRDDPLSVISK